LRLLFIICESSVDTKITDLLSSMGAPGFSRFSGGTGFGSSGPREGTPVWPGLNSLIIAAVPEDLVLPIKEQVGYLKAQRAGKLAVKIFVVPMEEW